MEVIIDSRDGKTNPKIVKQVHQFKYLPAKNLFCVPAVDYDFFYDIECQLALDVVTFTFIYGRVDITFATFDEAVAFGTWLDDANKKAKESFRTMAG